MEIKMVYTEYSIEKAKARETNKVLKYNNCLLYTSDAADE